MKEWKRLNISPETCNGTSVIKGKTSVLIYDKLSQIQHTTNLNRYRLTSHKYLQSFFLVDYIYKHVTSKIQK